MSRTTHIAGTRIAGRYSITIHRSIYRNVTPEKYAEAARLAGYTNVPAIGFTGWADRYLAVDLADTLGCESDTLPDRPDDYVEQPDFPILVFA